MDDRKLESEAQRQVAAWVRDLPEESPSMVWRASLNEKVRAEADRRARTRWRWTLARPALGLATAAALALVLLAPRPVAKAPQPGLEASLIALHEDSVRTADIVGTGLRPSESPEAPFTVTDPTDDLEAL